jgi:hypothetical protein
MELTLIQYPLFITLLRRGLCDKIVYFMCNFPAIKLQKERTEV